MARSVGPFVRCLGVALSVALGLSSIASATSVRNGVITGTVVECPPGPIVATPGQPSPSPKPTSVLLMRDGRSYRSDVVTFPKKLPWSGSFLFRVPAGRYDVLSTYQGRARWVTVKPGRRSVVTFGHFACPL